MVLWSHDLWKNSLQRLRGLGLWYVQAHIKTTHFKKHNFLTDTNFPWLFWEQGEKPGTPLHHNTNQLSCHQQMQPHFPWNQSWHVSAPETHRREFNSIHPQRPVLGSSMSTLQCSLRSIRVKLCNQVFSKQNLAVNSFCKWLVPWLQNGWKFSQWLSGHTWKYWAPRTSRGRATLFLQSWTVTERGRNRREALQKTQHNTAPLLLLYLSHISSQTKWIGLKCEWMLCLELPLRSKTLQGERLNWKHCRKSIFIRKDCLISNAKSALLRFQAFFRASSTIQPHPSQAMVISGLAWLLLY